MADYPEIPTSGRISPVVSREELAPGLVVLRFLNERVATRTKAGQFVNVLPALGIQDPMLRRPFSVYTTDGKEEAEIIVQVHGRGTRMLAETEVGDSLDVLGPLGNPWKFDSGDYETAILVVGGVGVASMPSLTRALEVNEIAHATYYGARTKSLFARKGLSNVHYATDDGSEGFPGTNLQLLAEDLKRARYAKPKLFVCGPTPMMIAAQTLARELSIPCEVSLETEMACGIGICQGCPVMTDENTFQTTGKRFRLVCTEGPSFDAERIVL